MTLGRRSISTSHYLVRLIAVLASAFLLLAACTGTAEITMDDTGPIPVTSAVPDRAEPTAQARPTTSPAETQAAQAGPTPTTEILLEVLVATKLIPGGTSVRELLEAPTRYLTADLVPEQLVADSAITSVADLADLDGFVLPRDVLPGEQLLRSRFRDPNDFTVPEADDSTPIVQADEIDDEINDDFLATLIDVPAGHVAHVMTIPRIQAVGGLLRAGEQVRIVGTVIGANGNAVSVALVDAVEVLDVEALFDSEADPRAGAIDLAITIAATPDEFSSLFAGRAESPTITLASVLQGSGEFAVMIYMRQPQALQGQVRRGDVVSVVSLANPGERPADALVVATDIEVLTVSSDDATDRPQANFSILLSVTGDELLAITTAVANGQVALDQ